MDYSVFAEEIKKIIQPVLDEEEIELVELSFIRTSNNSLLRLLVDRKNGGISLGDCVRINRKVESAIDVSDIIKDRYVLEVSSPGLDRPLRTKNDFLRNKNKKVKFFLREPINGRIEIDGSVIDAFDDKAVIETAGGVLEIPLNSITKAKQIIY